MKIKIKHAHALRTFAKDRTCSLHLTIHSLSRICLHFTHSFSYHDIVLREERFSREIAQVSAHGSKRSLYFAVNAFQISKRHVRVRHMRERGGGRREGGREGRKTIFDY